MKNKCLVFGILFSTVISLSSTQSFGSDELPERVYKLSNSKDSSQNVGVLDIKLDCSFRETAPTLELLTQYPTYHANAAPSIEKYKVSFNNKVDPRGTVVEILLGRDVGCKYLANRSYSTMTSRYYYTILSMTSNDQKFCPGKIGDELEFFANSNSRYGFVPDFREIANTCNGNTKYITIKRDYYSRPLGQAGEVPDELSLIKLVKKLF